MELSASVRLLLSLSGADVITPSSLIISQFYGPTVAVIVGLYNT